MKQPSLLLDILPEFVTIDDVEYFVDTDFRTFVIFEKLITEDRDAKDIIRDALSLVYSDEVPRNVEAAYSKLMWLYNCGETPRKNLSPKNGSVQIKPPQIYDFEFDAPYIYGAFLSQYGIDLNEIEYLHWWKFRALFRSLNASNKFVEIMGYRATDLSQIDNPKEKSRIARLQQIYAIPKNLTFEEKVAGAGMAFGGGMFNA